MWPIRMPLNPTSYPKGNIAFLPSVYISWNKQLYSAGRLRIDLPAKQPFPSEITNQTRCIFFFVIFSIKVWISHKLKNDDKPQHGNVIPSQSGCGEAAYYLNATLCLFWPLANWWRLNSRIVFKSPLTKPEISIAIKAVFSPAQLRTRIKHQTVPSATFSSSKNVITKDNKLRTDVNI